MVKYSLKLLKEHHLCFVSFISWVFYKKGSLEPVPLIDEDGIKDHYAEGDEHGENCLPSKLLITSIIQNIVVENVIYSKHCCCRPCKSIQNIVVVDNANLFKTLLFQTMQIYSKHCGCRPCKSIENIVVDHANLFKTFWL